MSFQNFGEARLAIERGGIFFVGVQLDAVAVKEWSFIRQLAVFFVLAGQFFGFDLAGFHIRLIEGVDADDGAGDGGGDFPAEEFLAEIVNVVQRRCELRDGRRLRERQPRRPAICSAVVCRRRYAKTRSLP